MDYSWYYDQIKDAVLEPLEVGEKVKSYYLRRWPGRRMMSTLIIFSPEGIVLTGDLRPTQRGGCMTMEYGLIWFCSDLAPRYLAEKFLQKKWQPARAEEWLRDHIKDLRAVPDDAVDEEPGEEESGDGQSGESTPNPYHTDADRLSKLLEDLSNFDSPEEFYWALNGANCQTQSYDYEIVDGGVDYDDNEVGWLYAIQRRFAELMRPQLKSNPIEEGVTNQ